MFSFTGFFFKLWSVYWKICELVKIKYLIISEIIINVLLRDKKFIYVICYNFDLFVIFFCQDVYVLNNCIFVLIYFYICYNIILYNYIFFIFLYDKKFDFILSYKFLFIIDNLGLELREKCELKIFLRNQVMKKWNVERKEFLQLVNLSGEEV